MAKTDYYKLNSNISVVERTIYFWDVVNPKSALDFIRTLNMLERASKNPIEVVLRSPGGSCADGFAMYDAIRQSQCRITIVATGVVASMGFILTLAGDDRYTTVNTRFMMHQPWSEIDGTSNDFQITAKEMELLKIRLMEIIAERSKLEYKEVERLFNYGDKWYSAEEAKELGIVNDIVLQYGD